MTNLTPEQILALLENIIREAPDFIYEKSLTDSDLRWLGRAEAILEASKSMLDLVDFRTARQSLHTFSHSRNNILAPLHNAYFKVELRAPTALQGAFIPAGDTWNGYSAIVKLLQHECDEILVIDPYLNSDLFTDFMPHCVARKKIRCLTAKRPELHPGLSSAAQKWANDETMKSKHVEIRYVPNNALHDRLVILDGLQTFLISQSLKDIAKRSPASVSRADPELSRMKFSHYTSLWNESTTLM